MATYTHTKNGRKVTPSEGSHLASLLDADENWSTEIKKPSIEKASEPKQSTERTRTRPRKPEAK